MEIKRPGDVPLSAEYSASAPNSAVNTAKEALFKPKAKPAGEESLYSAMGAEFSHVQQDDKKTNMGKLYIKDQKTGVLYEADTNEDASTNIAFKPDLPRIKEGERVDFSNGNYAYTQKSEDGASDIASFYSKSGEFLGTEISKKYSNNRLQYLDEYDSENKLIASTDYLANGAKTSYATYDWENGVYQRYIYNSAGDITAYEMTENGKGIRREYEINDGKTETVGEVNIQSNFVLKDKPSVEQQQIIKQTSDTPQGAPLRRVAQGERIDFYTENTYLIAEKNADGKNVYASEYNKDGSFAGTITYKYNDSGRVVSDTYYDKNDNLRTIYEYGYYPDGKKSTFDKKVYTTDGKLSERYKTEYNKEGNAVAFETVVNGKGQREEYLGYTKKVTPIDESVENISDEDKRSKDAKPDNGKTEYQYYSTGAKKKEVIYDKNGVVTGVNLFNEDGSLKKAIPYKDGKAVLE